MKNRRIYKISLIIAFFCGLSLYGQNPMSLYYMETIPQLNRINPAMQPRANGFLALPSVTFNLSSDLAFHDLILKDGDNWRLPIERQFDFKKMYNKIGKSYDLGFDAEVGILGFGARIKNGYFSVTISERVEMQYGVPNAFFEMADKLFPDGSKFDLSTFNTKALAYKQISFGYSHKINDELTVGINLRPIFGQMAVMSKIKKFDFVTTRDIWSFDADGEFFSSAPIIVTDDPEGGYPEIEEMEGFDDFKDWIDKYGTSFKNPGIGFDFGVVYKLDDRITFSAALNNLGFINWKEDLNSVSFKGYHEFEGIEINEPNTDYDDYFEQLFDELEEAFDYQTDTKKFTTSLMPSLYVGASYELTRSISVGLLSRTIFQQNNLRQSFNLSGNFLFYDFLSLSLNLNQNIKGGTNAGLGLSMDFGLLQFYLLADHIPIQYANIKIYDKEEQLYRVDYYPTKLKEATIMCGLNVLFGRKGVKDRPMFERKYH